MRELVAATLAFVTGTTGLLLIGGGGEPPVPEHPKRVLTVSPALTEMAFEIGAGDQVVGVSSWVTWPEEARKMPSVGGFMDVNFERIVELRPDLILYQNLHQRLDEQAPHLGIARKRITIHTIPEICEAAREMGRILGRAEQGRRVAARLESELDEVRERSRGRKRVRAFLYLEMGFSDPRPPYATPGAKAFLTEVMDVAGADNIFGSFPKKYLDVNAEELIARSPDLVIVCVPGAKFTSEQEGQIRQFWTETFQARKRAPLVEFLTVDYALLPGPRVGKLACEFERLISHARQRWEAAR